MVQKNSLTVEFDLLCTEGSIIRNLLCHGLTAVRAANFYDKGVFYVGFFQLSIGCERFLKLLLILDSMYRNDFQPPSRVEIKRYGHDIRNLWSKIIVDVDLSEIEERILTFLSDFALNSRYYNIDTLSTPKLKKNEVLLRNPLDGWNDILKDIYHAASSRKKESFRLQPELASAIDSYSIISYTNINGDPISDFGKMWQISKENEYASQRAVCSIMRILSRLKEKSEEIERKIYTMEGAKKNSIPYLSEFWDFIFVEPERDVIRKKKWP